MPKDGRTDGRMERLPLQVRAAPWAAGHRRGPTRCCGAALGPWGLGQAAGLRCCGRYAPVRVTGCNGLQAVGGRRSPATGTEARQHLWHTAGAELRAPEPTALLQSASRLLWQHLLCAKRATGRQLPGGTVAGAASGAPSEPGSVFPLGSASFCTASPSAPSARKRHSCTGSDRSSAGGCF